MQVWDIDSSEVRRSHPLFYVMCFSPLCCIQITIRDASWDQFLLDAIEKLAPRMNFDFEAIQPRFELRGLRLLRSGSWYVLAMPSR